jgi:hypothetical protein
VINLTQAIGWTVEDKTNELDKVLISISK